MTGPLPSDRSDPSSSAAYLIQVVPSSSPQDEETSTLVQNLRDEVVPAAVAGTALDVSITGTVASNIDFTEYLAQRIVIFFGAVLALSFLLLMVVFRSIVVPIKAVIMNLLSIAAAYGIVVAVFQWGWFGGVFWHRRGAGSEPFIPNHDVSPSCSAFRWTTRSSCSPSVREQFRPHGRRSGRGCGRPRLDGAGDHGRRRDHGRRLRQLCPRGRPRRKDVRLRARGGHPASTRRSSACCSSATMELLGARNWWLPGWLQGTLPRISIEGHPLSEPVRVRDE